MLGIIGAMAQEVNAMIEKMDNFSEDIFHNHRFIKGTINNKEVVVCRSGVGKVNASITTTLMIIKYNPDYIINIGTAGGMVETQNTLDIVISDNIIQHDYDTSAIDGKEGIGIYSESDKNLRNKVKEAFDSTDIDANIYFGDIISGDLFVADNDKILDLREKFPSAIACEMEAGAIGQTCEKLAVPFIVIRSLSDIVLHDNSHIDFLENVEITSKRSADMVEAFLR